MPEGPDRLRSGFPAAPTGAERGGGGAPSPLSASSSLAASPPVEDAGPLTVPNAIALARLCAVPLAVWLVVRGRFDLAFLVFAVAGLSDAVDGWWARTRGARSALGAVLDPLADKALLVSMYVALAAVGALPDWLAILVVFRDVLIVGGVLLLWLTGQPPAIRPLLVSKANTALQIALAAAVLLLGGFGLDGARWLVEALVWLVAATTLASGAAYVVGAVRRAAAAAGRDDA